MAKAQEYDAPARHRIPRTNAAAKRAVDRGELRKLEITLKDLPEAEKANWMLISQPLKKQRVPCGYAPLPGGGFRICYIDPKTGECNGDCFTSEV